jgi:hypothetical protein
MWKTLSLTAIMKLTRLTDHGVMAVALVDAQPDLWIHVLGANERSDAKRAQLKIRKKLADGFSLQGVAVRESLANGLFHARWYKRLRHKSKERARIYKSARK